MNTLQLEFELIIDNKYQELKNECETYKNIEMAIERYLRGTNKEEPHFTNYLRCEFEKRLKKDAPTTNQ